MKIKIFCYRCSSGSAICPACWDREKCTVWWWHSGPFCPWKIYLQKPKLNSMDDFNSVRPQQCFWGNLSNTFWTETSVHIFLALLPYHLLPAGYLSGNISSWTFSFQLCSSALKPGGFLLLSARVQQEAPEGQGRPGSWRPAQVHGCMVLLHPSCGQRCWARARWTWGRASLSICKLYLFREGFQAFFQ